METLEPYQRLALALAIGLLMGIERGWHERALPEGRRAAGIRTFGLIGLLGGFAALLAETYGIAALGAAFLVLAGVMITGRLRASRESHDVGLTTTVASLLAFVLSAVAVIGDARLAAAGAVIATLLLGVKPTLHAWLERIDYQELLAVLKLLVMSVVLLPVLPNRGYGPWEALNPFELWLMVVLIAGISFVGYVAVRVAGTRAGLMLAGLAGGLASSTAVTFSFSRLARINPAEARLFSAGIVVAAATMFPRILLVASAINSALVTVLIWPLGFAAAAGFLAAAWLGRGRVRQGGDQDSVLRLANPFELGVALRFGAILAAVILCARALEVWLGDVGLYLVAAVSGLTDVDAITLSYARMAGDRTDLEVAAIGILIAAVSNSLLKAGIAVYVGGRQLGLTVALPLVACVAAGAVGFIVGGAVGVPF